MSTKNLIFSLHEEWETHGQSFIWQKITKLLEHISSKVRENCRGLESGPESGGIGSVIELAMARNKNKENQALIEDSSQNDSHPKVGASIYRSSEKEGQSREGWKTLHVLR